MKSNIVFWIKVKQFNISVNYICSFTMPLMAGPNTAHPRHEACRETESREPEGKPQKYVQKCLVSILNISSDGRRILDTLKIKTHNMFGKEDSYSFATTKKTPITFYLRSE